MKKNKETNPGSSLTGTLKYVLGEWRKGLFTAMPGIITSYDPTTKRAEVQPAITTQLKAGGPEPMPILPDVPVVFPSGGGWSLAFHDLDAGDPVLLIFCQRGIGNFKSTFGVELPSGGVMGMDAAVAIAGFGELTGPAPAGIALQNSDGTIKVDLSDAGCDIDIKGTGGANLKADGAVAFKNGANVTSGGDFVTKNGVSLDNHVHDVVSVQSGPSTIPSEAPTV